MNPRRKQQDGFALLIVMWVLVILSVLIIGFARRASLERQTAWYALDREQSQQAARAAVTRALQEMVNRPKLDEYHGQVGYTGMDQSWAEIRDLRSEGGMLRYLDAPNFKADHCTVTIEDCESRFSVNDARREVFDELDYLNFKQVRVILERRDTDQGRRRPHRFFSLGEFRAEMEIPDDAWFDEDGQAGAENVFTVWGDPMGRVNINTASAAVLRMIPDMDESTVEDLIAYRNGVDGLPRTADDVSFRSLSEAGQLLELEPREIGLLSQYGKTDSAFYIVRAEATRRRGGVNASCTVVVRYTGGTPQILYWHEGRNGA